MVQKTAQHSILTFFLFFFKKQKQKQSFLFQMITSPWITYIRTEEMNQKSGCKGNKPVQFFPTARTPINSQFAVQNNGATALAWILLKYSCSIGLAACHMLCSWQHTQQNGNDHIQNLHLQSNQMVFHKENTSSSTALRLLSLLQKQKPKIKQPQK